MDYVIRQLTCQDEPILWEMLYYGLSSAGKDEPPPRDVVRRPEIARYVEGWGRVGDTGFVARDKKNRALLGAAWLRRPTDKSDASAELALAVKPEHRRHGIGTGPTPRTGRLLRRKNQQHENGEEQQMNAILLNVGFPARERNHADSQR